MTYDLAPEGQAADRTGRDSAAYRRDHFRVFDEDGFRTAFALAPPECATLAGVTAYLLAHLSLTGATGYDSKDLVVLLGPRVVAVVREGKEGCPEVTTFET